MYFIGVDTIGLDSLIRSYGDRVGSLLARLRAKDIKLIPKKKLKQKWTNRGLKIEKVCLYCSKTFDARMADHKRGKAKFCGLSCANESRRKVA